MIKLTKKNMMRTTKMIQNRFRYLRLIMPKMIESLVDSKRSKRSRMTLKIFSIHYAYVNIVITHFLLVTLVEICTLKSPLLSMFKQFDVTLGISH
ncbi:hypothetical protein BLOT_013747 [Blomia tropicalis]|nr:hypothetical protein BLOT_013747 [Blomia tropicalis]